MKNTLRLYKDAYSDLPKEIWVLSFLTIINRMGTMVIPFLSVYLTTILDFSFKDAGILASAFGFGSMGGSYFGGKLTDKYGSRFVILTSLSVGGLLFICLQFVSSFYSLFLFILLTSLFGEAYRPAMAAAIGDYASVKSRGKAMAFNRLAINLGMSAAPTIGGFVAATLGYHWLFWIDGLTCILASIYFGYVSKTWEKHPEEGKQEMASTEVSKLPYKNPKYLLFLLSTFLMGFAFIQWFHTVPVFIKTDWGFDERYIGILMGLSSLMVTIIEMPITHVVEKRHKIKGAIRVGLVLLAISYIPFVLPSHLGLCFVAVVLWTMGEILLLPFNNAIPLSMGAGKTRGTYLAWYFMTWSLANITAPTVGLSFADRFGFDSFWLLLTALVAISWLMNVVLGEKIMK